MPDMYKEYKESVIPKLKDRWGYQNIMKVPQIEKILITTGISTKEEKDAFNESKQILATISGQIPVITKAKRNISQFKLRKGMPVGVKVTLRNARMYDFYDRLVHYVLPQIRDFRGVNPKGFDGSGNYNLGISDISVFSEIDLDKIKRSMGINICIVTSANTDDEARDMLHMLEMPFAE